MQWPADLGRRFPTLRGMRPQCVLADGPLSCKWLVELQGTDHVLRVDKPAAATLHLDRSGEAALLAQLAAAGWAPPPVCCAPDEGLLVLPHRAGSPWRDEDYRAAGRLRRLGVLLARLHATPMPVRGFELAERIGAYAGIIATAAARQQAEELQALIAAEDGAPCLCHNDPIGGNVVGYPDTFLIDWEFAALGAAAFDLAAVIEAHELTADEQAALLSGYRAVAGAVPPGLARWRRIYGLTGSLWSAALATLAGGAPGGTAYPV